MGPRVPGKSLARVESVRDMLRQLARRHQDHIEANFGLRVGRIAGKLHLGSGDDAFLAEWRFEAAGENAVALGDEKHGGAALGRKPEPEGFDAVGPRRLGRSKRFGAACH
jgi:hypothetical protein